ncbi:MAG TPA: FtsX-like permease family protein, partial [Pseudomonadales bacterium]|nr:FtsX-like permease family protein [Pseudomonadales bacterium]
MLVAAAGLLIHSFVRLAGVDAGFSAERVLTFQVATSPEAVARRRLETNNQLVDRLRALLLAYSVAQRTREIGVRMALGAPRRGILALVLGQGAVLAGIGGVTGLAGAFAVTRYLSSLLFGITPLDPATFVAVALVFAGVALPRVLR